MATTISLGVHQPSALSFLAAEGSSCDRGWEKCYKWKGDQASFDAQEEEILFTDHCVVWSQNGLIRRVFRFDVEGENVTTAIFINLRVATEQTSFYGHFSSHNAPSKPPNDPRYGEFTSDHSPLHIAEPAAQMQWRTSAIEAHGDRSRFSPGQNVTQRAMLVVLKSQAHVFFPSGTSHVIHLPFEIECIFPLPNGVLIQRKVFPSAVSHSSSKPSNPAQNSFAVQTESFQGLPLHLQDITYLSGKARHVPPTVFEAARSTDWDKSLGVTEEQPYLFYLNDPLSELAAVTFTNSPDRGETSTRRSRNNRRDADQAFGGGECLLYASSEDELFPQGRSKLVGEPLMLIVLSLNRTAKSINFWTAGHERKSKKRSMSRRSEKGVVSRRRSSHGPGLVTGATTPVSRSFLDPRESLGLPSGRTSTARDILLEESEINGDDKLLSQLGSALEPSNLVQKPSRRVSSLLARADLAASFGGLSFPESRNGHQIIHRPRRAVSTATYGNRPVVGRHNSFQGSRQSVVAGPDAMDVPEINETSSIGYSAETDTDSSVTEYGTMNSPSRYQSARAALHLTKFHSVREEQIASMTEDILKVFVIRSPRVSLNTRTDLSTLYVGLFNRDSRTLEMYKVDVQRRKRKFSSDENGRKVVTRSEMFEHSLYKVSCIAPQCDEKVIDVCKAWGKFSDHIILLTLQNNGTVEVSVQAPWAKTFRVDLPSMFNLHNPFRLIDSDPFRSRRDGGFKRVLSRGPGQLVRMGHIHGDVRLDFINTENVHHRVEIQLRPKSRYISRMIEICEAVLPPSLADQEVILEGWREVNVWLASRWEEGDDTEWPALLIFIFSLVAPHIKESRSSTVLRPKRRKGGLLRSSSGANTNLESWETMLEQEKNASGTSPPWLQDTAWRWAARPDSITENHLTAKSKTTRSPHLSASAMVPMPAKTSSIVRCVSLARDFCNARNQSKESSLWLFSTSEVGPDLGVAALANILIGLHSLREELKLDTLAAFQLHSLTPVLAQLGTWLKWPSWSFRETSYYMSESADMTDWLFDEGYITGLRLPDQPLDPPNIFLYLTECSKSTRALPFPSLKELLQAIGTHNDSKASAEESEEIEKALLPRSTYIRGLIISPPAGYDSQHATFAQGSIPQSVVALIRRLKSDDVENNLENRCFRLKEYTGGLGSSPDPGAIVQEFGSDSIPVGRPHEGPRDVHSICNSSLESQGQGPLDGSAEIHRHNITRMLFKEDQRFIEASKLLHPLLPPTARCDPEPDWSDTDLLEAQQELVKTVALRTLSVSLGRGCLSLNARSPLLTEKFPIHGFTLSCVMKPSNTTVTADRNSYTEEKVSWAFFHAGVEAGLSIAKHATGIDTSWILFNKPADLKNRHAGFLLALGLNGHLRTIVKWVAFKYLTPKHTMTSIGLLLGLSASYLGTMDTLVTRLLSVHVTRMLPPGAAELNLSPLTQTSGIMGIGLLYCATQHRRMSEIMLSEIENIDDDDSHSGNEALRDESYRLAAGFALGYINLGRGDDLKGLHDMHLIERLLSMAVGNKKVSLVHVLDKATPGAIMAVALIFMKTHNEPLAKKMDIPDTFHQYDSVRPDVFLLRTVTHHLIMWNDIHASLDWVRQQLPGIFKSHSAMAGIRTLNSEDLAFFNIVAGLCLSIGLRHAGSGSTQARDVLCFYLDQFTRICRLQALDYDARLTRITVRNCQDTVALAAASVMAGTGDLLVFRRLRSLHGRTDVETSYGSHMAAHLAIGILFLGGGTHTLSTSNLAIASLLCAFYPLFPSSVLDNKVHLQAFRHFWVLAAEARCLIVHDIETHTAISLPIRVHLRSGGELVLTAPCLLPELDTIAKVQSTSPDYWEKTFDFANRASDLTAFKRHQTLFVRRRAAYDTAISSPFSVTMQSLNDSQSADQVRSQVFEWTFSLPSLARLDRAETTLVLPPHVGSSPYVSLKETVVDDQLVLEKGCMESGRSEQLWNLRLLFDWAETTTHDFDEDGWLTKEFIEMLKARLAVKGVGAM